MTLTSNACQNPFIHHGFKLWKNVSAANRVSSALSWTKFALCFHAVRPLSARWVQSWTLTSVPVRGSVELFWPCCLPLSPLFLSLLHCVFLEKNSRLCWFPQFWGMRSPCQDKQTGLRDDVCWIRFPGQPAGWGEDLHFARKTKSVVKLFVLAFVSRVQMPSDGKTTKCLFCRCSPLWLFVNQLTVKDVTSFDFC